MDSERGEFEKQWCPLATICKDKEERLGSDLQGEFSTIKLPLRLRGKNSCSLHVQIKCSSACLRVRPSWMLYHVYKNDQIWHLEGEMKTQETIHRDAVKSLNYIPVKITRLCVGHLSNLEG